MISTDSNVPVPSRTSPQLIGTPQQVPSAHWGDHGQNLNLNLILSSRYAGRSEAMIPYWLVNNYENTPVLDGPERDRQSYYCTIGNYMLHVKWYHVCWPRLTAKRVEPVVSISWASCYHFYPTVRPSVCRWRSVIVSKRMDISSNVFDILVEASPKFFFKTQPSLQKGTISV